MKRLLTVLVLSTILPACSTAWLTPNEEWGPGLMHWGKTTTTGYPAWTPENAARTHNPMTAGAQDSQDQSFMSEGTAEDQTATSDENNSDQEDQGVMAQDTTEGQNTLTDGTGDQQVQQQDDQTAQANQNDRGTQDNQSEQANQNNQEQESQTAQANQSDQENQAEQTDQNQDNEQTDENVMATEGNADSGKTDASGTTGTIGR